MSTECLAPVRGPAESPRAELAAADMAATRALNWRPLFEALSWVQKLVHLAARWTEDDQRVWRDSLFKQNRRSYEEALRREVEAVGCGDPGTLRLREGPELKALAERAEFSAGSIVNTYNYDLAREIARIGRETPTANRHVYAYRLQQWGREREARKSGQINDTELGWSINRAKQDFHRRNAVVMQGAEVRPYHTVCSVCAAYVAGNPYRSVEDLYRDCELPAHVRCPHHAVAIMERRLDPQECKELWMGG